MSGHYEICPGVDRAGELKDLGPTLGPHVTCAVCGNTYECDDHQPAILHLHKRYVRHDDRDELTRGVIEAVREITVQMQTHGPRGGSKYGMVVEIFARKIEEVLAALDGNGTCNGCSKGPGDTGPNEDCPVHGRTA